MNKSELVEQIQVGHRLLKAMLAELSDEQMLEPGVVGKWSVKDILAHIVTHKQYMIQWIDRQLRGETPQEFQPYDMPEDQLARLNEQIYLENRDRPLAGLLAELDQSYVRAVMLVFGAQEADLTDTNRFKLAGGEPLWEAVAANTFWHYEEHGRDIRAWMKRRRD